GFLVFDFALDKSSQTLTQVHWRNQQAAVFGLVRESGQVVEELACVRAEVRVSGQQSDIGVNSGRYRIVVSSTNVKVAPQRPGFAPNHQRKLAMSLQSDHPVDNVNAHALQASGPLDVALFVKPSLQLD